MLTFFCKKLIVESSFFFQKKTFRPIIIYDSNRSSSSSTSNSISMSRNEQALIEERRIKIRNRLDYNAQMWENEGRLFDATESSRISSSGTKNYVYFSFFWRHNYFHIYAYLLHYSVDQPLPLQSYSDLPAPLDSNFIMQQQTTRSPSNKSSMSFVTSPISNQIVFSNDNQRINSLWSAVDGTHLFPSNVINTTLETETQTSVPLPTNNYEFPAYTPDRSTTASHLSPLLPLPSTSQDQNKHIQLSITTESDKEERDDDIEHFEAEEKQTMTKNPSTIISFNTTTFINEPEFHHTYRPNISRKRRRENLPKQVTEFLKQWLVLHKKHPYPTEREKQKLADETGLMVNQISNWFINARRRILQPLIESENRQQQLEGSSSNHASSSVPPPTGVNVVGGSSNDGDNVDRIHSINNPITKDRCSTAVDKNNDYNPHHHYHYNHNSSTSISSLLLQQPSEEDSRDTDKEQGGNNTEKSNLLLFSIDTNFI
jgi:hypothetical protein